MSRVFKPTDTLEDLLLNYHQWTEAGKRQQFDKLEFVYEHASGFRRKYTILTHIDNDLIPKQRH